MRLAGLSDDAEVRASLSFDENTVGALMDFRPVLARDNENVGDLLVRLQQMGELPSHCDKLFVVDAWERLVGVLPLKRLLLNPPQTSVQQIAVSDNVYLFRPGDDIEKAAGAFERYDLISAPVVDDSGRVVGRATIDDIVEHMARKSRARFAQQCGDSRGRRFVCAVAAPFYESLAVDMHKPCGGTFDIAGGWRF